MAAEVEARQHILLGNLEINLQYLMSEMKRVGWSEVMEKVNQVSGSEIRRKKNAEKVDVYDEYHRYVEGKRSSQMS